MKYEKNASYIEVSKPGEIVGIDMLEISKKERIVVLIDYFSRKIYAKLVNIKEGYKIVNFLDEIYKNFRFEKMIADNGKEFANNKVDKWV